ncbi:hypothetical protein VCCP1035_1440B, partial [Vibrio cholerae CP1035(8)]
LSSGMLTSEENTNAGTKASILMRLIGRKSGLSQRPIK